MKLTIEVEVLKLKRCGLLSGMAQEFPCSFCGEPLGNRPWGLAWVRDEKGERGMRLCGRCLLLAKGQEPKPELWKEKQ